MGTSHHENSFVTEFESLTRHSCAVECMKMIQHRTLSNKIFLPVFSSRVASRWSVPGDYLSYTALGFTPSLLGSSLAIQGTWEHVRLRWFKRQEPAPTPPRAAFIPPRCLTPGIPCCMFLYFALGSSCSRSCDSSLYRLSYRQPLQPQLTGSLYIVLQVWLVVMFRLRYRVSFVQAQRNISVIKHCSR